MEILLIILILVISVITLIALFFKGNKNNDISKDFISLKGEIKTQNQYAVETQRNINDLRKEISQVLDTKLNEIRSTVSEKLDKTLNDRLDSNFRQIGDQLGLLGEKLGELKVLGDNVTSLKTTLASVKKRGTWGEMQLKAILEETMPVDQYEENIPTKKNSNDRVEFAIKIPTDNSLTEYMYLPIDSKLPTDIYDKIVDASDKDDVEELKRASEELRQRIRLEARTIRDKYIDVPRTTDFAIMFLPTESLYAEVLRIRGLAEGVQSEYKIMIAGPATITALLNSLRLGFSNIALTKKTQEVLKLLQSIKMQYGKFDEEIEKTQKQLQLAEDSVEKLKKRNSLINKRMAKISTLESKKEEILEIDTDFSEDEE